MHETRTPLDPDMPGIRDLLADIEAGQVIFGDNREAFLDLGENGHVRVADAVYKMRQSGWVEQPPDSDQPGERDTARLTPVGRAVLKGG